MEVMFADEEESMMACPLRLKSEEVMVHERGDPSKRDLAIVLSQDAVSPIL